MNKHTAELLEQHFDTAFAAPDGIKKLRELILTLAMQGKLVPQDPNEQPASELLQEIEAEKQRLVKEGRIKQPKPLPPVTEEEKPYALPQGWEWVRFPGCYFGIGSKANQIQANQYQATGEIPVVDQGKAFIAGFTDDKERVLEIDKPVIVFGDHTKNIKLVDFNFVIGADGVKALCPYDGVKSEFIFRLMQSYDLDDRGYARHFKVLNSQLVPLPPLEEQNRIVAKIDELMARCDELEKLRNAQQGARLTVHAAAIKQLLNIAEPGQHQRAQTFLAEHFGELYTVKENVTELRKAILQLAVMGKLVPQDPNDQPASELLKEIEAEKQRLVKEGKIKKPKPLPQVTEEEKPYPLPQGWEWVRLHDALDVRDGTHDTPKYVNVGYPLVTSKNIYTGSLSLEEVKYISKEDHEKIAERSKVDNGDIIFAMIGSIGNPVIIDSDVEFSIKNVALFKYFLAGKPCNRYLHYYLFHAQGHMKTISSGAVQSFVSLGFLRKYPFPLPPLQEQHRIVAKIDELMALCDSLEQQIDANTSKQTELLSALIRAQSQGGAVEDAQGSSRSTARVIDLATYRASIGCYAINKLANAQYFGRTAAAKVMYLAQAHIGLDLDLKPEREAAGPLDTWIYDFEREGHGKRWFEVNEKTLANGRKKTEYRCLPALSEPAAEAEAQMTPGQKNEFDRLIYALADKKTEEVEIIATLFAVWNDFLIDGVQPTDTQIISDVRENWHERKARFTPAELGRWLDWLRRENIIPRGLPPRTVQQPRLNLDG